MSMVRTLRDSWTLFSASLNAPIRRRALTHGVVQNPCLTGAPCRSTFYTPVSTPPVG